MRARSATLLQLWCAALQAAWLADTANAQDSPAYPKATAAVATASAFSFAFASAAAFAAVALTGKPWQTLKVVKPEKLALPLISFAAAAAL